MMLRLVDAGIGRVWHVCQLFCTCPGLGVLRAIGDARGNWRMRMILQARRVGRISLREI